MFTYADLVEIFSRNEQGMFSGAHLCNANTRIWFEGVSEADLAGRFKDMLSKLDCSVEGLRPNIPRTLYAGYIVKVQQ